MNLIDPASSAFYPRAVEFCISNWHPVEVSIGLAQALNRAAARIYKQRGIVLTQQDAADFAKILASARYTKPLVFDGTIRKFEDHLPSVITESIWWKYGQHDIMKMTHAQQCGPGESILCMLTNKGLLYNGSNEPGDYGFVDQNDEWMNVEVKSGGTNFFLVEQRDRYAAKGVNLFISLVFRSENKNPTKYKDTMYRGLQIDWLFDEQYVDIVGDKVKLK